MNLYKFYNNDDLDYSKQLTPEFIWKISYPNDIGFILKHKHLFASSNFYAYNLARLTSKPFPEGENAIGQKSETAINYAFDVLNDVFPKGENSISTDAMFSYMYARELLKGRFHKAEKTLENSEYWDKYLKLLSRLNIDTSDL